MQRNPTSNATMKKLTRSNLAHCGARTLDAGLHSVAETNWSTYSYFVFFLSSKVKSGFPVSTATIVVLPMLIMIPFADISFSLSVIAFVVYLTVMAS